MFQRQHTYFHHYVPEAAHTFLPSLQEYKHDIVLFTIWLVANCVVSCTPQCCWQGGSIQEGMSGEDLALAWDTEGSPNGHKQGRRGLL